MTGTGKSTNERTSLAAGGFLISSPKRIRGRKKKMMEKPQNDSLFTIIIMTSSFLSNLRSDFNPKKKTMMIQDRGASAAAKRDLIKIQDGGV